MATTQRKRSAQRWPDRTVKERQAKRTTALNAAAQSAGFASWGKIETAVINGATVTVNPPAGAAGSVVTGDGIGVAPGVQSGVGTGVGTGDGTGVQCSDSSA